MRDNYIVPARTRNRLLAGVTLENFDDFAQWLRQRGHSVRMTGRKLSSLAAWSDWLAATERTKQELSESLAACAAAVRERPRCKYQHGVNKQTIIVVRLYLEYLRAARLLEQPATSYDDQRHPLLAEFCTWMMEQRGVVPATIRACMVVLTDFVWALGDDPDAYTPRALRDFAMTCVGKRGKGSVTGNCTAVRAFLRFLVATGRCAPRTEEALPAVADRSGAKIPYHLTPDEIKVMLNSVARDKIGLRNRAMLLLRVRLGLRGDDVVNLRLSDVDFREGTISVSGEGRRVDVLPLPQEVGDAMVAYLRRARPNTDVPEMFVTSCAPYKALQQPSLPGIVGRTMDRAGLTAPTRGCRLLRHSAATNMLSQGVTLAAVGSILRHRRPATTVI